MNYDVVQLRRLPNTILNSLRESKSVDKEVAMNSFASMEDRRNKLHFKSGGALSPQPKVPDSKKVKFETTLQIPNLKNRGRQNFLKNDSFNEHYFSSMKTITDIKEQSYKVFKARKGTKPSVGGNTIKISLKFD